MLAHGLRRWPNIKATLVQCVVFVGTSLSAQSLQYRDRRKPEAGTMPYFRMTSRVLYSAQYHRQHCTLHACEQFGSLYMHNQDDKYPSRPGFEPGTPRLQAPVDTNEPSGRPVDGEATLKQHWAIYSIGLV